MIEKLPIEIGNTGHITNCYILYNDNKEAIIIDPADKPEIIEESIKKLNLQIKYIFLTHAHADHTFALNYLLDKYPVKVVAHENEKDTISGKISDHADVFERQTENRDIGRFIFVKDNDNLSLGNYEIQVIHTPGHTSGSVCYYLKEQDIMFTGDTMFSDCFGRCDLETGDIFSMVDSLIRLYSNYGNVTIYPGHDEYGMKVKDTYESINQYLKSRKIVDLDEILN